MSRALVLGETGMLGHTVAATLRRAGIEVIGTTRMPNDSMAGGSEFFDVTSGAIGPLLDRFNPSWVVNCIGIIKPYIRDDDSDSVRQAITVNSLFPHILASEALHRSIRVIQIATDCVYSGKSGGYTETSPHDPLDVYGKSKSLGEVEAANFTNIRASIIGREVGRSTSLVEWFLGHKENASVSGFVNHLWNGVTTLGFAKVIVGLISQGDFPTGSFNLIPHGSITKFELLTYLKTYSGRSDIQIQAVEAPSEIDRTLSTEFPQVNQSMWANSPFEEIPTVEELVAGMF